MRDRTQLLRSIAATIADYRAGEIEPPTPDHVERWIRQFDEAVQEPILAEVDHVLAQTYIKRSDAKGYLTSRIKDRNLVGPYPLKFWRNANFLSIQQNGQSQEEMLTLAGEILAEEYKIDIDQCGSPDGHFIYLDDAMFTGVRVGNDLEVWITDQAPSDATIHILVLATHAFGEWRSKDRLEKVASAVGKKIDIRIQRNICIENRNTYRNHAEVLWPAIPLPNDTQLDVYLSEEKKYPFQPRVPGSKVANNIFSSEKARQLLETEFLMAGLRIRSFSANPYQMMRPLGYSPFGLGFGSMIVTYRNCPNNCPLALWWGDPSWPASHPFSKWYPLLPRKTYGPPGIDYDDVSF